MLSRSLALPPRRPRCRPIFEASHFCPTASTSSSPGRFGGCERGERVREWTGARWRGWAGEQGCATPPSPTWNPYIILRILAAGRRRARAGERAAELSLTISSFGLSEKFAGRRERSTAESVPDCNGNRQPTATDRRTGVRHTLELRRRRKGPRRASAPRAGYPRRSSLVRLIARGIGSSSLGDARTRGRRLHNFSGLVGVICFRTRHGTARHGGRRLRSP